LVDQLIAQSVRRNQMEIKEVKMENQSAFNFKSIRGCSRREFLTGCLVTTTSLFFSLKRPFAPAFGSTVQPETELIRPKIRLIFSHLPPDRPTWPNIGYNYDARKKELLEKLCRALPEIDFLPVTVHSQKGSRKTPPAG